MEFLSDKKCSTADQLYQMALVGKLHVQTPLPDISNNVGSVKSFFERTSPFTPVSGLPGYLRPLHRRPRLVRNLSIGFSRPKHLFDPYFDTITNSTPFAGSGCPIKWTAFYCTPCPVPSCPRTNRTLTR